MKHGSTWAQHKCTAPDTGQSQEATFKIVDDGERRKANRNVQDPPAQNRPLSRAQNDRFLRVWAGPPRDSRGVGMLLRATRANAE